MWLTRLLTGRRWFLTLGFLLCSLSIFAIGQAPDALKDAKRTREEEKPWPLPKLPYAGSPHVAVQVAHLDAMRIPEPESYFFRYLWLPYPQEKLPYAYVLLKYHANRLSRAGKIGEFTLVTQDVVRLDTRDFLWDEFLNVWEKFAKIDFVFHQQAQLLQDSYVEVVWPGGLEDGKDYEAGIYEKVPKKKGDLVPIPARWLPQRESKELRHHLLTEVPILMANWWFVQSARQLSLRNTDDGVGYYNWLGIKDRNTFLKLCGVDQQVASKRFMEYRASIQRSGISQQSRIVGSLGAIVHGRVWFTLDTFKQAARGQPRRNLRPNEFAHNAEEWYGFNPVGLDVVGLFDNAGKLQASAPDQIGPDDSALRVGHDARVHINISCVRCHGANKDMLQTIDDRIRRQFHASGSFRLQDPSKKVLLELEALYLRDINELLNDDRAKYARAIARVTATHFKPEGLTCLEVTRLYGQAWNEYVEEFVTPDTAARELGVSKDHLVNSLYRYYKAKGGIDAVLAEFLELNGKMTRLEWEDSYPLVATVCMGIIPQDEVKEVKILGQKQDPKTEKNPKKPEKPKQTNPDGVKEEDL